jgi:DNA invertase Pin-like site-specific DNA recombinase
MSASELSGNVYLYQRFSSQAQEGNSSLFRQGEAQREWLRNHPNCSVVELEGKPLIDSGLSAFSGKHLRSGSLGRLVAAIESKVVPKGSIILVEHFSRLSRMTITETGKLLDKIWDHDISIVTARDHTIYSPSMRDDVATRMRLIFEIDKAHSDSKWRSEKVKSSWVRRELNAKENKVAPKMRMPFWLNREGKLNEYADVVRDIFKLHADGLGQVLIERALRKKYGEIKPLKNVNPTKIIRIIQNPKCIGLVYNEKLYDAVVSNEIFYNAQRICEERLFKSVRADRKWPLHGMVKCGHCGSGMSIQQSAKTLPLLRCSRKQRSAGEYCDSPTTTFPYVIAYHFFHIYLEPIVLALLTNLQVNNKSKSKKVELQQQLKNLQRAYTSAEELYNELIVEGKDTKVPLRSMTSINEKITSISEELERLQAIDNKHSTLVSISRDLKNSLHEDSKKYNIELNKLGLKIVLKNKELLFGLDETDIVARLKYSHYDRKLRGYIYDFQGSSEFYANEYISGMVRTDDWTIDRLLNPRADLPLTPKKLASIVYEANLNEQAGLLFPIKRDYENQ